MVEYIYRSTFSWPRHQLEVSGQLHAAAGLTTGKEHTIPIGKVDLKAGLDEMEKPGPEGVRKTIK
jgi:hypothetical protein